MRKRRWWIGIYGLLFQKLDWTRGAFQLKIICIFLWSFIPRGMTLFCICNLNVDRHPTCEKTSKQINEALIEFFYVGETEIVDRNVDLPHRKVLGELMSREG